MELSIFVEFPYMVVQVSDNLLSIFDKRVEMLLSMFITESSECTILPEEVELSIIFI